MHKKGKNSVIHFITKNMAKEKTWFILALVVTMLAIVANFLMPQIISVAVDKIITTNNAKGSNIFVNAIYGVISTFQPKTALIYCAVGVCVLSVLSGVFTYAGRMSLARANESFVKNLRDRLFGHIQHLPFQWHTENPTGDIIQRCTSDIDMLRNFMNAPMLEIIRTTVLVVVAVVLMFSMNWVLALIVLVFIPVILAYTSIFFNVIGKRFLQADEAEGEVTVAVQENLTAVRVVRAFGRQKFELDKFNKYNDKFTNIWLKLGGIMGIYWGTSDIVTGLMILTVIVVGSIFAVNGTISLGEFMVFVFYAQNVAWPVRTVGRAFSEMSKTSVSIGRIQEILKAQTEAEQETGLKPELDKDIHFENVSFGYADAKPILKNISFTIPHGSTFGILGAAGSGKSTITYLLNRLYDLPQGDGKIFYGDIEIKDIDRYYLRENVGLVLQEPFLFSKTIEENIAITQKDFRRKDVRKSARIAAVDDAISGFSHGYETVVGERGVTLSGGQKQRVAIARTLMRGAPIMIFDDSMSAVDLETDANIREALRSSAGNATLILISHRINTLMKADKIMVIENGELTEVGSHKELIAQPGLYKRIYDMQSSFVEEE